MNFLVKILNMFESYCYKNNKILIAGWTASGSTFIYQTAKLLELEVDKAHGFVPGKNYFLKIFTIRDPRDIITSNAKRVSKEILENFGREEALKKELFRFLNENYRKDYYKALKDIRTLIIKYELFMPNKKEDVLVSFIAHQFGIQINEKKINDILKETSIEKNKKRASGMVDFETWDEESSIHGDHITSDGNTGSWRSFFTEDFVTLFKDKLGDFLIELGYEEDSAWELNR